MQVKASGPGEELISFPVCLCSYLEDAVMNLDHTDPLTRDHMATVLTQVRQKLFAFLQHDPHSPLGKKARRLMMMLQGLVSQ